MSPSSTTTARAFRRPLVWMLSTLFWIVLGLVNSGSEIIDIVTGRQLAAYWEPLTWELTSALGFALITPFLIEFALNVRFSRVRAPIVWAAHAIAVVAFSLIHVTAMVAMREVLYRLAGHDYDFGQVGWELLYEGLKDSTTYFLLLGLIYGADFYRRFRERQLVTTQLEASLARAQLEGLEQQIQPHFLFNTLNMISSTMHDDVDRADRMIMRLSDLLRLSMQQKGLQEVPLTIELEMLTAYLEIMQARFEDRLQVDLEVADGLSDIRVPPLLLQPLVENAIKHGMQERPSGGRIRVQITQHDKRVRFCIEDDGPGIELAKPGTQLHDAVLQNKEPLAVATLDPATLPLGTGMTNTLQRLEWLYGAEHQLTMRNRAVGGLQVEMVIPLRRTSQPEDVRG